MPDVSHMSDKKLLEKVRKMNESAAEMNKTYAIGDGSSFDFHSADQAREFEASISDIVYMMQRVKESKKSMTVTRRLGKKKTRELDGSSFRLMMSKPKQHPKKWCSSNHLDPVLLRKLSLPIDADATGSIYSPCRDLPRTKEGQAKMARETLPSFKPGEIGKIFGEPPIDSCSDSYQMMLERHLVKAVDRIRNEYGVMPWGTVKHSELKGNIGRDLATLEERLQHVLSAQSLRATPKSTSPFSLGEPVTTPSLSASASTPALSTPATTASVAPETNTLQETPTLPPIT